MMLELGEMFSWWLGKTILYQILFLSIVRNCCLWNFVSIWKGFIWREKITHLKLFIEQVKHVVHWCNGSKHSWRILEFFKVWVHYVKKLNCWNKRHWRQKHNWQPLMKWFSSWKKVLKSTKIVTLSWFGKQRI